jgi:putative endonuclease
MNKPEIHELGRTAEAAAEAFLVRQGYSSIARNYHTRLGEIDIICRKDNDLVFVEVKAANSTVGWAPELRVNKTKRRRLRLTALDYLAKNEHSQDTNIRFDVISMELTSRNEWKITHIPDAFRDEESDE